MQLAEVFEGVAGPDAEVEFVAYDGSRAGRPGSPPVTFTVKSPVAVSYLAQAPGALGLARAFVSGHIDIEGDMYTALARLVKAQRMDLSVAERLSLLSQLGGPRLLLKRVAPPPQEVRVTRRWIRAVAILAIATRRSRTTDVSNTFAEWVLVRWPTCAPIRGRPGALEQAQSMSTRRQEDVRPGMRLLDVGCGWGGMVCTRPGSSGCALGVTLSEQALWAQRYQGGLQDLAEVRHLTTARSPRPTSTLSARSA